MRFSQIPVPGNEEILEEGDGMVIGKAGNVVHRGLAVIVREEPPFRGDRFGMVHVVFVEHLHPGM